MGGRTVQGSVNAFRYDVIVLQVQPWGSGFSTLPLLMIISLIIVQGDFITQQMYGICIDQIQKG